MIDAAVRSRLLPGERIEWSGAPARGIVFTAQDIVLIPFSLMWCGFAIFWETSVAGIGGIDGGAPIFMLLWGGMFVAVGLFFVFGRFLLDMAVRRATTYALTDRRVLIVRRAPFARTTSLQLDDLPFVDISGSERRGTITFGDEQEVSFWGWRGVGSWSPALERTPKFVAIERPHAVYDLIQRLADRRGKERGLS